MIIIYCGFHILSTVTTEYDTLGQSKSFCYESSHIVFNNRMVDLEEKKKDS